MTQEMNMPPLDQVIDDIGKSGRTAVLISFVMPSRISGNTLSRADIQSLRTDDLADENTFYQVLKALGEIGEAALSGAPRLSGDAPPFGFKGDLLGMQLSDFKEKHRRPVNGVTAPFCSSEGATNEPWHRDAAIVHCMLDSPLEESGRTVGGVPTTMLLYEFVDEQLFRISVTFSHDEFDQVEQSVRQKYGEPMRIDKRLRQLVWANALSSIRLIGGKQGQDAGLVFVHEELFSIANERARLRDPDL